MNLSIRHLGLNMAGNARLFMVQVAPHDLQELHRKALVLDPACIWTQLGAIVSYPSTETDTVSEVTIRLEKSLR
jgi:hypothetical protein